MESKKKNAIYGNWRVYHPDGSLMFFCDEKRANWYLSRNLADFVTPDSRDIKLNFVPNGYGNKNDPFYLQGRENKCVVCGAEDDLTRHHAVPHCFRRHFPEKLKSRSSHDVVPLCIPCHERYELFANGLKRELGVKYNVSISSGWRPTEEEIDRIKAGGAARSLIKYWEQIPNDRRQYLLSLINIKTQAQCETFDDVLKINEKLQKNVPLDNTKSEYSYGKLIVDQLEDFDDFIRMWRQHFLDVMQPKFLSAGWDINHRLKKKE